MDKKKLIKIAGLILLTALILLTPIMKFIGIVIVILLINKLFPIKKIKEMFTREKDL